MSGCPYSDAGECAMARERQVAGISDVIPPCPVHGGMTCFATVSVIVSGALDSEATVLERDWDAYLNAMLSGIDAAFASDGQPTEVYILWHEHDMGVECECMQYVTDHHPDYVWGEQS